MTQFRNQCVILIGPSCSGKTSWLEESLNDIPDDQRPVVLSSNALVHEEAERLGVSYAEMFTPQYEHQVARINLVRRGYPLYTACQDAIRSNKPIVIDRTNLTVSTRDNFLRLLPPWYERIGIVFATRIEDIFERLRQRNQSDHQFVPIRIVRRHMELYQEPDFSEFDRIIHMI